MNSACENTVPLTRIQKLIGKYMLQSKRQGPCCYLETRADVTSLANLRRRYCKQVGVRVTTNDFFFCAIGKAVKKFPLLAGHLDDNGANIRIGKDVGVGFAVAAPQGLVVPVIKDILGKSLSQIATCSGMLVEKARANKLTLEDFDGANIIFSSLGMYGVSSFLAIKPPGVAGIISVGKIEETLVPLQGDLAIRKIMSVGLAVDRRLTSEFYAAQFLNCVVNLLQNPKMLTADGDVSSKKTRI
ncbi:MAG: 2-oxo acid dehydrogenase subunit E2 [Planctomycetota bacterium]|jgi:pyruvate dehydrogenase E2 component (dihydrolipoamide acetyltransferase)